MVHWLEWFEYSNIVSLVSRKCLLLDDLLTTDVEIAVCKYMPNWNEFYV